MIIVTEISAESILKMNKNMRYSIFLREIRIKGKRSNKIGDLLFREDITLRDEGCRAILNSAKYLNNLVVLHLWSKKD